MEGPEHITTIKVSTNGEYTPELLEVMTIANPMSNSLPILCGFLLCSTERTAKYYCIILYASGCHAWRGSTLNKLQRRPGSHCSSNADNIRAADAPTTL